MAKVFAAATNVEYDIGKEIITSIDSSPGKILCLFHYIKSGKLTRIEASLAKEIYVVDNRPLATISVSFISSFSDQLTYH